MKIMSNPKFAELAQNTVAAVTIETCLKALGRPTFTYLDQNVDKETKKYSASKEFLYQALCLGIYVSVIPLVFKRGGYSVLKNSIFKNCKDLKPVFEEFSKPITYKLKSKDKELSGFKRFLHEFNELKKNDSEISDLTPGIKAIKDNNPDLKDKEIINSLKTIKGGVEVFSIIGSIVGLTIFAPMISHKILHPLMNFLGLEKKNGVTEPDVDLGDQSLAENSEKPNINIHA